MPFWFVVAIVIISVIEQCRADFRPPAVPLVTFDPYLSIWSRSDRLTDVQTTHWTGQAQPLISLIQVDGQTFRLMGAEPRIAPALPQQSVTVWPTRTIYEFKNEQVHVTLTFMTAALPNDLTAYSQPLSYLTWQVRSVDGITHAVEIYASVSSLVAVNDLGEGVQSLRERAGPLTVLRVGSVDQPILRQAGDNVRINWGYAYTAARSDLSATAIGRSGELQYKFMQRNAPTLSVGEPALAFVFDLHNVSAEPVSRQMILAYDEIDAIKYFGTNLHPYWNRSGITPEIMLQAAFDKYPQYASRCERFDRELMADLTRVGGKDYADIAALAYRQCAAACGLAADANGRPLLFTKENTSNGDVATVDVIYPMDPVWLLLSPTLAKASLVGVLDYGSSSRWKFPCSPHDLGTYPIAGGRDDGGEAMPVEESGNVLLLIDAISHAEGNPAFAARWWPTLTKWAGYLEQFGLDPADQLCTDDFMGHLAHNANLSIKAILALAAYGDLCRQRGDVATANRYAAMAKADAANWIKVADGGDYSLLAFDKPHTWSQKYNLVWDRILNLHLFPPDVASKEIALYVKKLNRFGLPLDSRTDLTKTDWTVWSASLANKTDEFERLITPVHDYLNKTMEREPLADSYVTTDSRSSGMHARPVVGGVFVKMLTDPAIWKKWAARDEQNVGDWAPFPK